MPSPAVQLSSDPEPLIPSTPKFEEVYKSLSDNVNLQHMDVTDRTVDDVGQELESKVLAVLGESVRPSAEHVLW